MLTRSLDQIIHAANSLPAHLTIVRRCYGDSPDATRALRQLQDALVEVEIALFGRGREPLGREPLTRERAGR